MANRHLKELENRLSESHWVVQRKVRGDGWPEVPVWVVSRPDGLCALVFRSCSDPELDEPDFEDAYAVDTEFGGLYFSGGASWDAELANFVAELNRFERNEK